ncbi:MAG: hypothetical protein WC788_01905 [Candidatus Paceibacterota bacterium]|jgi:hypothetical protein
MDKKFTIAIIMIILFAIAYLLSNRYYFIASESTRRFGDLKGTTIKTIMKCDKFTGVCIKAE